MADQRLLTKRKFHQKHCGRRLPGNSRLQATVQPPEVPALLSALSPFFFTQVDSTAGFSIEYYSTYKVS
jgi:hypothetical protein